MAVRLADGIAIGRPEQISDMVLALGGLMIGVGLAFKLSAVPFHFWCPDVFEGASAEVNAFLSRRLEGRGPGAAGSRGDWVSATLPRRSRSQSGAVAAAAAIAGCASAAQMPAAGKRFRLQRAMQTASALKRNDSLAPSRGRYHRAACGADRGHHLHVRQPGRLRPDEHQAAAGLFHDRPCRLHDDAGRGRRGAGGQQSAAARGGYLPRWRSTSACICS